MKFPLYCWCRWKRRPAHRAPAEQMEVEVEYTLSCVRAAIGHETVATLQSKVVGNLSGSKEDRGQYWSIFGLNICHRGCDVATGNKHDMLWCLGVDIPEGHDLIVLVHDRAGYSSGSDFAK